MFSILFVCTGNLCRSPMAERFARHHLNQRLGTAEYSMIVASAGTRARPGMAMSGNAAKVLAGAGADTDGFTSRPLTESLIAQADLILTAERAHRSEVVTLDPAALRRSFTLIEFARTAETGPPGDSPDGAQDAVEVRARAVVASAARRRGTVRPSRPEEDDLADPIGRELEVYEAVAARIRPAVETAVDALLGGREAPCG